MHKKHIEMGCRRDGHAQVVSNILRMYKLQNELKKDKHEYFYRMINP